jgi:hypothetical protein
VFGALGCKSTQFTCNDGSCIPIDWRCDGIEDCVPEGEDEAYQECSKGEGEMLMNDWL